MPPKGVQPVYESPLGVYGTWARVWPPGTTVPYLEPKPVFKPRGLPEKGFFEFGAIEDFEKRAPWVRCLIGDGSEGKWIETKGGLGAWEFVRRPYLPPLTIWKGPSEPYQHKIPFLIDGWHDRKNIEQACREINEMAGVLARPVEHRSLEEPPLLYLDGYGAIPYDYTERSDLKWIITEIEWGEPTRVEPAGYRVRQAGSITFAVAESDVTLERLPDRRKAKNGYRPKVKEDFNQIAQKKLGDWMLGTKLARKNGHQNGTEKVPAGAEISLPNKHELDQWRREVGRTGHNHKGHHH